MEEKRVYQLSIEKAYKEYGGCLNGLREEEVTKRQEQYGANEIEAEKKKSVVVRFFQQFKDFLVLILIVAAVISAVLGDAESAVVILVVITINAVLGVLQEEQAEKSLDSLKKMSAPNAKVLRESQVQMLPAREVTVGDIVLLEAGDYICADGRIVENASLKVNESALTGESLSVEKTTLPIIGEAALGDRTNMVFSGSFVSYGRASFLVTAIGMKTEMGKIARMLKETEQKKTPLQKSLNQFGKILSIIILVFCGGLFLLNVVRGQEILDSFLFAVALAVAAIPEALSSIVTIVLSFGTRKMAKEHAVIRRLQAVEGLGSVSVICSDKTGTLTQNKMEVKKVYPVKKGEQPLEQLLLYSVLCNDARNENGTKIGDPTETALIDYAEKRNLNGKEIRERYQRMAEIPFDSERKLMSAVYQMETGLLMVTKGAVDVLLNRVNLKEDEKNRILEVNNSFSKEGLRVLAFAVKKLEKPEIRLEEEYDLEFAGLIAMMDPPREESKQAVADCIAAGIRPVMITGDHKVTAAAIAEQIGILTEGRIAVEGSEIDGLSDEELRDFVLEAAVYARVSPEHKIRIVRAWQEKGNIVAMTGDGVNDAPALKQADIGVAMGITGTEVAKDAASMVLTDDNFATIVKAVENGRNVYRNIKRAILFLLSGNTAGILLVLFAAVLNLPVPFAPVHLLFINLLTDSLPAIALGLEPHSKEVMQERPRNSKESILTKSFGLRVVSEGFLMSLFVLAAFLTGLRQGDAETGSTMAFAALCLTRLLHGFNCKAEKPVLFQKRFFDNRYLLGAFAVGFLLLNIVLFVPLFHTVFQITSLKMEQTALIYAAAGGSLLLIQLKKALCCFGRKK